MDMQTTTFSYPGWQADRAIAERLYVEYTSPMFYHEKLQVMKNKQRLHEGDRTHEDIVQLEQVQFSYPGWQEDKIKAEDRHVGDCPTIDLAGLPVKSIIQMMKRKQALHNDRGTIQCLRELDKLKLTYPDWQEDQKVAEKYFIEYEPTSVFRKKIDAMKNKQRLHDGDRSHPDIRRLDELKLTYPGCDVDKAEALKRHTGDCFVLDLGSVSFQTWLCKMKKKQEEFADENNNECTKVLANLSFSYPGWKQDLETAKKYYVEFSALKPFNDKVYAMKNKQRLFEGNRSHPDIAALDSLHFNYEGWVDDKLEAERRHTGDCSILDLGTFGFDAVVKKMKKKQQIHSERASNEGIQHRDRRCSTSSLATQMTEFTSASSLSWGDDISDKEPNRHCVICFEGKPSHAFIPCGHLCICTGCTTEYNACPTGNARCPLCRETAMYITKIFI